MDDVASERAVASAIEAGVSIDRHRGELRDEVGWGRGLKASGIPREDVFVTTKFNKRWHGVELVPEAFEASAARLVWTISTSC